MTTVFLRSGIGHSPGDRERQMLDQYRMDLERPWWFQTARDVRESDETKIRDYKEDIDTLLVFGALFSAVITALTIESYKSLTPDPAELTLQVMVHISQQLSSYTTTGQVSNSTIPAFVLPNATDFAPSSPIIITNVAWFGSLTISLMAASYGMLVKQWLREYLAYRDASPIARLRVRLFRYPALAEWKVFEIVAMLPLLLQIALGLFFLGLCFFASSIHPAVKWTIIPLVVIWASLFLIATFAPIFSSRCPYKTTFLKDIMKRLRRVIFIVLHKVKNPSANAPPGPEEEDDLGKRSDSDLDVVARTDSLHQDDGLIAPALVDLGRQLPGPDVVTFLFAVLRNRDPRIERKQVDCLVDLHQISIPLLGAATTALIASLRLEYTRQAATREQSSQSADQSDFEWAQDAFSILLSALRNPLLARPSQAVTDYLSIVPPHFIDTLIDPVMDNTCYSEEQRMAFFKLLIHYIDPSSGDAKDPRPLNLHNLSERGWNHVAKVFESLIFPRVLATSDSLIAREWNHDIKLGFRGLFGVCDHDVPADVSTRIHESFTDEELIEQLLSPITASYISGHTTEVTFYLFRLFPNELSGLSEDSWRDVQNMLIVVLEKELEHQELDHQKEIDADSRTTPVVWEKSILSAIHVLLSMSQFPRSDKAMEMVIRCFDFDCEGLLDALPGGIAETFTHLIPLLWHVLTGQPTVDIEESWAEDSIDGQSQLDAAMWNVAISLHRVLKSGGSKDNEQRLALRIMFMCAKASEPQTFSNATRTRIDELMQSHTRRIVDMLPTERGRLTDYALSAFWEIMRLLDHSQTLSIIKHLYPTTYAHEVAEKLLEVWSSIQSSKSQNITNIPLGGTEILILNPFIVSHIDDSLVFGGDARSHYMDKLQPLVQLVPNEHASHTIKRLAWRMITFEHPDWPEWVKSYLSEAIKVFLNTSELHECIKFTMCWNAPRLVMLLASHIHDQLDPFQFPLELGTWMKEADIMCDNASMLRPFSQNPEPLVPQEAETFLMRLIASSGIDKPVLTCTTDHNFWSGSEKPPPRYPCVSLALRILRYHLGPKGVDIPTGDICAVLDLSNLEKEVWDDVSAAAAEIIARKDWEAYEEHIFGGLMAFGRIRMKATMILLADSPYPFFTSLSYEVLDQTPFFLWDECPELEQDDREKLERQRQSRIEEGRRNSRLGLPTGDGAVRGTRTQDSRSVNTQIETISDDHKENHSIVEETDTCHGGSKDQTARRSNVDEDVKHDDVQQGEKQEQEQDMPIYPTEVNGEGEYTLTLSSF